MVICQHCKVIEVFGRKKFCEECKILKRNEYNKLLRRKKRALDRTKRKCVKCKTNTIPKGGKSYCEECSLIMKKEIKRISNAKSRNNNRVIKKCEHCKINDIPKGHRKFCKDCTKNVRKKDNRNLSVREIIQKDENLFYTDVRQCIDCGLIVGAKKRRCADCNIIIKRKRCVDYKKNNKNMISSYNKIYKEENAEDISLYNHNYNINNREEIQTRQTRQHAERLRIDPVYKLATQSRSKLCNYLNSTVNLDVRRTLIGCSATQFKEWLAYQFESGFSFDNRGTVWVLDHVIPISKFDILDEEEFERCFHWSNVQPLTKEQNLRKTNKTTVEEQVSHQQKIDDFVISHSDFDVIEFDRTQYV